MIGFREFRKIIRYLIHTFSAAPFLARKRIETFKKNVILQKSAEPV